ncbi:hypothetical protein BH10BAC6_BH10BAC6_12950 [soil metagenome]
MPLRLLSYNIAANTAPWQTIMESDVDVALLQEVSKPPTELDVKFAPASMPWENTTERDGVWKCAVAQVSSRYKVSWLKPHIAQVLIPNEDPILVVSMYARWQRPNPAVGKQWIFADGSAHDRITELSAFMYSAGHHRIIARQRANWILYSPQSLSLIASLCARLTASMNGDQAIIAE